MSCNCIPLRIDSTVVNHIGENKMDIVERKRPRGAFLNLFDWPGKSRKKLFSSNISQISGMTFHPFVFFINIMYIYIQ